MSDDRLEFKITHDLQKKDVYLEDMSLEIAKVFVVIIQSITGIVELTSKNKNLKISVRKGSAVICVEGSEIKTVETKFRQVIERRSTNKQLVEQWRRIQNVLNEDGAEYEANFYRKGKKISIIEDLKSSKKLRTRRKEKPPVKTNIEFLTGRLMAVGGKKPNIHVEVAKQEKALVIECTELKANKAKAFLYKKIWLSVWVTQKGEEKEYVMCDSYWETQQNLFNRFSQFIKDMENSEDEIESLKILHYRCQEYLKNQDYGTYRKFLRLFNTESSDLNVLKTLLIVSRPFNESEILGLLLKELELLFEKKLAKA
ncbi:MAG: hypothetical protein ABIT05_06725 [Chitinophagaceae bacterium]